jgi:hypothetical protein
MPNIPARAIRVLVLAASPLLLLVACGGGNADPAPVVARPDPVQPSPPPPPAEPAQPAPNPPPPPPADPSPPPQPPADPPPPEPVLAADHTNLVDGTIVSPPGWNAWVPPAGRATVAGVGCLVNENFHQHSLVSIYKDGVRQGLPGNIGRGACNYELHTHDVTGVVHIETDVAKKFSLGQFFALWNQPLAANGVAGLGAQVRFYVIENEKLTRYTGDPAALELVPHGEIVIVSGNAPAVLPKYRWPSGL